MTPERFQEHPRTIPGQFQNDSRTASDSPTIIQNIFRTTPEGQHDLDSRMTPGRRSPEGPDLGYRKRGPITGIAIASAVSSSWPHTDARLS